ncbi:MAG: hypothetical protein RIR76_2831 [Verrucomicrobiota bacterium]|jgi:uncharacterized membrane protein|nr:DUF979 domain-containing protein [Opitutaceae bacterium]
MTILGLEIFLVLAGLGLGAMAVRVAMDRSHPRRAAAALFWGLLAICFAGGKHLPPAAVGLMVVVMAVLAGLRSVSPPAAKVDEGPDRGNEAAKLGNRLLVPVLLIPLCVIAGGYLLPSVSAGGWRLVAPAQATQVALGLACGLALLVALRFTRSGAPAALGAGARLVHAIGWALILPQLLASLGGLFAKAGVGEVVANTVGGALPLHLPLVAVVAYCAAMALFTIAMGNAFAAFPVVTLGIGIPFIVREHGGNPAIMGALGMLSGYCGTLVTPMAANFNLVPAILLGLRDRHAVIRAQAPMAAAIWIFNVVLMALCVYRF